MWVKILDGFSLIFFLTFIILFFIDTSQTKSDWENKTKQVGEGYKKVLIHYPNNVKISEGVNKTINLPVSVKETLTCSISDENINIVKNDERFFTGIVYYKSCDDFKIFIQE